jgi:hypothetical protein
MRNPYGCAARFVIELFDGYEMEQLIPASILDRDTGDDVANEAKMKGALIRMMEAGILAVLKHAAEADYVEKGIAAFKAEAVKIAEDWQAKDDAG